MSRLGVFDVDGTLPRGFYIVEFPEVLYGEGLFSTEQLKEIRRLFKEYDERACHYGEFARNLVAAFGEGVKDKKREEVENAARKYIKSHPEKKFSFTDGLVNLVKEMGYTAIVISASPHEIILPFSESLGIDTTFATKYETDNDVFTGRVLVNCALAETKKRILKDYARESGADLASSCGFGDSESDLGFLEMVGYPVALNPSAKLEKAAKERGWLVCREGDKILVFVDSYLPMD